MTSTPLDTELPDSDMLDGDRVTKARRLGVARDVVGLSDRGVSVGFGIAKFATKAGFTIASACIRTPAHLLERATGPNPLSQGLKGVDDVVGLAGKLTAGVQNAAEGITHASLDVTKLGLKAAGAEEDALLRVAVGDEAAEAVKCVEAIVTSYTHSMATVPLHELIAAANAWGSLQRAALQAHGQHGEAALMPEHCERWMRFAAATMGTAWMAGLVEGFSVPAVARARALREQGGSPGNCALACAGVDGNVEVLKFEERTDILYAPGYLVAVDHELGRVVVALRGTSSVTDTLTDLVCEPVPIQLGAHVGIAHGGMLRAAQRLDEMLSELVSVGFSRLSLEAPRRLIICGHSLGAGVAAILSALWCNRSLFPRAEVQCVAFACPQVLDASLAVAQIGHTTSIILEDDLVPRLSLAAAQDLQAAMLCLNNPQSRGLPPTLHTAEILSAQLRGDVDSLAAAYAVVRPMVCTSPGRLFPPGQLVHLRADHVPTVITCDDLDELQVAPGMLSSHMPRKYLVAIQRAVASQS